MLGLGRWVQTLVERAAKRQADKMAREYRTKHREFAGRTEADPT